MLTVNFSDAIPAQDHQRIQAYYEKNLEQFFIDHPGSEIVISHDGTQWNINSDKDLAVIMPYFRHH